MPTTSKKMLKKKVIKGAKKTATTKGINVTINLANPSAKSQPKSRTPAPKGQTKQTNFNKDSQGFQIMTMANTINELKRDIQNKQQQLTTGPTHEDYEKQRTFINQELKDLKLENNTKAAQRQQETLQQQQFMFSLAQSMQHPAVQQGVQTRHDPFPQDTQTYRVDVPPQQQGPIPQAQEMRQLPIRARSVIGPRAVELADAGGGIEDNRMYRKEFHKYLATSEDVINAKRTQGAGTKLPDRKTHGKKHGQPIVADLFKSKIDDNPLVPRDHIRQFARESIQADFGLEAPRLIGQFDRMFARNYPDEGVAALNQGGRTQPRGRPKDVGV